MDTHANAPLSLAIARGILASTKPESLPWHYEHGLLLLAARRAGKAHGDGELALCADRFVDARVAPDGLIEGYRNDEYNLDQVNPGRLLILHRQSASPRIEAAIAALKRQLSSQPRCKSGGYWHKRIYPDQMWLDGLYMAEPFSAACAKRYGEPERLEEAWRQFALIEERARDVRTGLYYHAWDESRRQLWSNPETGCSPNFWSRAMGWLAMALVDVLDYMPEGHERRAPLARMLEGLLSALAAFAEPDSGLLYQVTDQGSRKGNYLESSASAMFAYAGLKASRKGIVSAPGIKDAALAAYRGLVERKLSVQGGSPALADICAVAGLGGAPYRDGSFEYYVGEPRRTNDHKGVGPFVLAALEVEALENAAIAKRIKEDEESV
jgi:unsaturated rhamnogalacturonyl hydrolase